MPAGFLRVRFSKMKIQGMKNALLLWIYILLSVPVFCQTLPSTTEQRLIQYFQNQEYAKAAVYLQSTLPVTSDSMQYLSLLGYACYMSNQFTKAAYYFERLLRADPSRPRALYYLGKINMAKSNLPAAQKYFCRLVERKPGVAAYYKQLAQLFQQLGNDAAAGWYFGKSHHLNPDDPAVTAKLASYRIRQKLYQKADTILDSALRQDSLQATLLDIRIHSAYDQKDYETIFPLAGKLKAMHAISLSPFLRAAIASFRLGRYDSCIAFCRLLAQHKLESRTSLYLGALSYKAEKKYKKALDNLNKCIAMSLDAAADNYFSAKGEILESIHQPSRALKQYDTAYYIFHHPLQLYNKARIYDAQFENYKFAIRYYRRYLDHSNKPETEDEKKVYAFVRERLQQLEKWERKTKRK